MLQQIGFDGKSGSPWERLFKIGIGNLIITALGFVPGYYASILSIEYLGRKWIQIQGFLLAALFRESAPWPQTSDGSRADRTRSRHPRGPVPHAEHARVHRLFRLPPVLFQFRR